MFKELKPALKAHPLGLVLAMAVLMYGWMGMVVVNVFPEILNPYAGYSYYPTMIGIYGVPLALMAACAFLLNWSHDLKWDEVMKPCQ
jgi:hypothetical protein